MKGIIVGPRGCGKTWLINKKWFKDGDIIIDPFNEHSDKYTGELPALGIGNIFNLLGKPINSIQTLIESFLNEVNGKYTGIIFIDSADIVQPGYLNWLVRFFANDEYKGLNIVIVVQTEDYAAKFYNHCDVIIIYGNTSRTENGWSPNVVRIKDYDILTKENPELLTLHE